MKPSLILLIILGAVLMGSCKKETVYHDVDPELISWIGYPKGSYWIMTDSASGLTDSIVGYGKTMTRYSSSGKHDEYQHLSYSLQDFRSDTNVQFASFSFDLSAAYGKSTSEIPSFGCIASKSSVNYRPFFSIPIEYTGYGYDRGGMYMILEILPLFIVNGYMFNNVCHIQYTFTGKSNHEDFYFNKEAGLIKIVQDNEAITRTLTVKRWHLEK